MGEHGSHNSGLHKRGGRQPCPPHCPFLHLSASLSPSLIPSPNTLSIYRVPSTVLGARDMVPPVTCSGGKSQEPRFQQHLTNHRCPTLGPSVRLFLFPLCPQRHDLISPHPTLPCEARPSSNVASSRKPFLYPHPPESARTSHSTELGCSRGTRHVLSGAGMLGVLVNSTGILRHPNCAGEGTWEQRRGTGFIPRSNSSQHPLRCGGPLGREQVGRP